MATLLTTPAEPAWSGALFSGAGLASTGIVVARALDDERDVPPWYGLPRGRGIEA
ncbi:hypothetical protein [Nonomuraea sp. NPDC050691]|uniref:hypothetical protein n=1 Tax=Nonomuraea sp. NPDC050691 TaxID=3155661 RepID=UPI00340FCC0A